MVHRRRAAVLRLDVAAAVSSTARDLGPQGHAGHGADHRCECQAGAIRRDRPADGAPGRADPSTCRRCRCPGLLARDTTPLPQCRHDLAARRQGQRTHCCAHPDAGCGARHPVSLAAQAGSGTERDGPTLAGTEAAHRCEPAGRLGRCSGQQRRGLGAGADTPADAPQGRDGLEALLAQEPDTRLLATYLEEVGAGYDTVRIDFGANEQHSPDYLAVNPRGRVPALVTNKGVLTETPAILAFITQSFPRAGLAPLDDPFAFAEVQAFN